MKGFEQSESENGKAYLRWLEKQNPDLAEQAQEFNREIDEKIFWNEEQLTARFRRDSAEYRNLLDWIAVVFAATKAGCVHVAENDAAMINEDFSDALHPDMWGRATDDPEKLLIAQARKAILLRGEVIMAGVIPSRLSEARYGAWMKSRAHY